MAGMQVNDTVYRGVITMASAAQATSGNTIFDTRDVECAAVDITLTSFTGGTSPQVQYFIERLGNDGVWYVVWQSTATGSAGAISIDLGPGFGSSTGSQHAVFTGQARFRWATTGSPTAVTFSASVVVR